MQGEDLVARRLSGVFGHAGAAIGVALGATTLSTLLPSSSVADDERVYRAFHGAFFVVAALALIGSIVAFRIRDSDARATLRGATPPDALDLAVIEAASPL